MKSEVLSGVIHADSGLKSGSLLFYDLEVFLHKEVCLGQHLS